MLITSIVPKGRTKSYIELDDGQMCFVLSNRDVNLYDLKEGAEIPETAYEEIRKELQGNVLQKCGQLLQGGDYTEKGLYDKLIRNGYPGDIAAEAVAALKDAGYVDDLRYAENYLGYHGKDRSRLRLRMDLQGKGIPEDIMEEAFRRWEQNGWESGEPVQELETRQIHELLRKKRYDPDTASWEEMQKLKAFLQRKGYSPDAVRNAVKSYETNCSQS